MMPTDAIGVVLAGGKSSRMGQDKAELMLGNESLLLRARRMFHEAGFSQVYLSGHARLGWSEDAITDRHAGLGPVGGMVSVLLALADTEPQAQPVLFMPVDAPCISRETLRTLLAHAGVDGCHFEGEPLPVLLKLTDAVQARCAAVLVELAAGRTCSVQGFISPLNLLSIKTNVATQHQLQNINTPQEWKALRCEFENRS